MNYTINKNTVTLEKLGKPKKITGTRFASILGLNAWNTPFSAWCDMTKLYKEPFEETKYTEAGKIIEPIILKYLNQEEYPGQVVDPQKYFGRNYKKVQYDFYPDEPIFGGMWDALLMGKNGPRAIIEVKTTKRAEDWEHDVPLYYKMQAMLYAYLSGVKYYIFAVAFLEEEDYEHPENFIANKDTVKLLPFDLDKDETNQKMKFALKWYNNHVLGLTSPEFDEKKDADILKELRTNRVEASESIEDYLTIIDEIRPQVEEKEKEIKPLADKLKKAEEGLKTELEKQFTDQDKTVAIKTKLYEFKVSRTIKQEKVFDEAKFKEEHPDLWEQYQTEQEKVTVRKAVTMLKDLFDEVS